jgi:hypothetical protein
VSENMWAVSPRIKLKKSGAADHPWMLYYGPQGDCSCGYKTWQEAVWDLGHAIIVTWATLRM